MDAAAVQTQTPGCYVRRLKQKKCRACGYETDSAPLTEKELWEYVRTGYSRFGGCPDHPFGWHYWNTDKKPPPRVMGRLR